MVISLNSDSFPIFKYMYATGIANHLAKWLLNMVTLSGFLQGYA